MHKNDFDAALIPDVKPSLDASYTALRRAEGESLSPFVDADGALIATMSLVRDCPICGAPSAQAPTLMRAQGLCYVTCPGCGLTYTRQVLTEAAERRLYEESPAMRQHHVIRANPAYAALETAKARYILEKASAFAGVPSQGGLRMLDIGSANGVMMRAGQAVGWRAWGIEANSDYVRRCQEQGLEVAAGLFPGDFPPDWGPFDVITLLDVLEHVRDPVGLLATVWRLLVPGGIAVIQVPNLDSLAIRVEGGANNNFVLGHWSFFDRSSLTMAAGRVGLRPLFDETIISEMDRIHRAPRETVHQVFAQLTGAPGAEADDLTVEELHDRHLGYKILAVFARDAC